MRRFFPLPMLALIFLVAACGTAAPGVATNPPGPSTSTSADSSASPTPGVQTSGVRTVLTSLGLRIHPSPALGDTPNSAPQGTVLQVLDHTDQNSGWYKVQADVQGANVTGWVSADPTLSAPGYATPYASQQRGFAALYPQDWTFAEETNDVLFRPQSGSQTIVVRNAATLDALGQPGAIGYARSHAASVVVCGVTADDATYDRQSQAPSPTAGAITQLQHLDQIRLVLDATHALQIDFHYADASQLAPFNNFYNSMTFHFPQCEK